MTGPLESDIFQGPEVTPDERTEEPARSQHKCFIKKVKLVNPTNYGTGGILTVPEAVPPLEPAGLLVLSEPFFSRINASQKFNF